MFYVYHLMTVNCSNRIKKNGKETCSFCLVHLSHCLIYLFFSPSLDFVSRPRPPSRSHAHPSHRSILPFPFIYGFNLVFPPTIAFVFYHKFIWLIPRLQLSERERQSLQEDNRLFKEEFGDKINSLQVEVEQLTKQRGQLEVELKREREQWLHLPHGVPDNKSLFSLNKGIQKTGSKIDSSDRHLEGDSQSRTSAKENTVLSSSVFPDLQDEQDQAPDKSKRCQLCQEESTQSKRKNICKNCGGVFCEDCSANELPLPSSIKPERVCNLCHKHLIQQYSASPS